MKKLFTCVIAVMMMISCGLLAACAEETANNSASTPEGSGNSSVSVASDGGADNTSGSASASVWDSVWSSEREAYNWTPATAMENGNNDGTQNTTVYLVGDSTVCEYSMTKERSRYYPRNGYGMWFDDFLSDKVTVNNLALSGRSSRSFLKEANYTTLKNSIKAGDYLVIGFGHNDEKTTDGYYTNPSGQVIHEDSFKYYLYNYYVKLALDKGATPILCTPIIRIAKNYKDANFHITTSGTYEGGDYPKAIRELGSEFGITVVDMTKITKDFFTAMAYEDACEYYARSSMGMDNLNNVDTTHINSYGAATLAYKFMLALKNTDNTLKYYIDDTKMVEPDVSVRVVSMDAVAA